MGRRGVGNAVGRILGRFGRNSDNRKIIKLNFVLFFMAISISEGNARSPAITEGSLEGGCGLWINTGKILSDMISEKLGVNPGRYTAQTRTSPNGYELRMTGS